MGTDLTLYVMDERTTPWSVVERVKLARHYTDHDVLQQGARPVPAEAIPSSPPDLASGRDGYGELTYRLVGDLPELPVGMNGSPFNAGVVAQIRARSRASQPVILWGH
jgi:hypothetical protein